MVYHHFPHENRNVGWRDPLQKRPETTYGRDSDQLSPTAASIFGSVATAATTFQQWISITKDFLPIAPWIGAPVGQCWSISLQCGAPVR